MKRTINKKIIIALLSALVAVCACFALLLSRPVKQAKAEETYSETWVIKEDWTGSENFSVSVPFSLNGLETTFSSFSIEISGSGFLMKVKEGDSEKYISYCFSQGNYSYFNTLKDISDTPFGSTVDYITWKDGFGKITFLADTSETEYAVLRSWLNANAEETEIKEYVESLQYGDAVPLVAESDNENERNYELPLDTWMLICNTDFKVRLLVNGEQIVSIGSPTEDWTNTEGVSYFLKRMDLGYLKFDSKKINSVYLKRYLPKETGSGVVLIDESCNYLKISIPVTYTITFKDGANELKSTIVNENAKADTIDLTDINTAKTGYTFKGWSKTDGGAVVNLANETITADTTYYAVYEINKYSVLFYYGTSLLKTATVDYGTKANEIDVSNLAPVREGYTFKGWARTNGGEVVDLSAITITQSMALFASYKKQTSEEPTPVTYTLTFTDGEKVLYTLSVESGKAVNLAEHPEINESAVKAGYTFKGWATTQDGAVIVKNGYIPNVTADTTFYAVYSEGIEPTEPTNPDNPDVPESTEYKVVFLVDNLVVYTATVKNGKAVSFADYPELSEKIKKDGYTFKGWKIEGQDEIYTDGIPVQNKTTVLVAVYEKKVLGIDGVSKAGSIVLTAAIGIVGVYFLFKLFGGKRRRR